MVATDQYRCYQLLLDYLKKNYLQLNEYLIENNIIPVHQSGFRKGDNQHGLGFNKWSCFLGLGKAFDTIDHEILMNRLYLYDVKGSASRRFKSYLTHRDKSVKLII